jgi:hypothetical protein
VLTAVSGTRCRHPFWPGPWRCRSAPESCPRGDAVRHRLEAEVIDRAQRPEGFVQIGDPDRGLTFRPTPNADRSVDGQRDHHFPGIGGRQLHRAPPNPARNHLNCVRDVPTGWAVRSCAAHACDLVGAPDFKGDDFEAKRAGGSPFSCAAQG